MGSTAMSGVFPGAAALLPYVSDIVFGLAVVLFLVFEPRGLAHRWGMVKSYYRLWPFSY